MNRPLAASLVVALAFATQVATATAQDATVDPSSTPTADTREADTDVSLADAPAGTGADSPATADAEAAAAPPGEVEEEEPGSPVTARYVVGEGVTLRSADGLYALTLKGRIQLRGTISDAAGDEEAASTEFQARRVRLAFAGHFIVPELTFYLQLGFANRDTEADLRLPLRDAWVSYAPLRDFALRVGQGKVPFNRQRVISSSSLQFADRSIVQDELTLDRDVGIYAYSKNLLGLGDRLGYQLGMFGGDGRNRLSTRSGLLWVARVEFSPFGKFESYSESDHDRLSTPRLQIAFGAALNKNSVRERSTTGATYTLGGFDYRHLEADLIFKWAGFSLQAEWIWRDAPVRSLSAMQLDGTTLTEYARAAWGYFVQGGYYFPFGLELAARYGDLRPRSGSDPALARARELGGAVGWYFERHSLKLQADYFYLFGDSFEGGRHQVRVQGQMQF